MRISAATCPQCGDTEQAYFPEEGNGVCWDCWEDAEEEKEGGSE